MSENNRKINKEDFDNYIEIQCKINRVEASILDSEQKIGLVNDAITSSILHNPNNELQIKTTYEPRLTHLRNKLK